MLISGAEQPDRGKRRDQADKTYNAGNFKEALDGYRQLLLDPKEEPHKAPHDLSQAISALQQLGRTNEIDELRDAAIEVHAKNWRLLAAAADSLLSGETYGTIVGGKFVRGHHRGEGRFVNSVARDRVRALQLFVQALPLVAQEDNKAEAGQFHTRFAHALQYGSGSHEAWRLQILTDLKTLPDYEDGWRGWSQGAPGAPVDEQGQPVFHRLPKSFEAAQSDGERWRWELAQSVEMNPQLRNEADTTFADFLRSQFSVSTLSIPGHFWPRGGFEGVEEDEADDDQEPAKETLNQQTGIFALHTLSDDETIARLATGIKRLKLPDEFNFIRIYREIAARGKSTFGSQALEDLAQEYEDRRQYVKAAQTWKQVIQDYGPGDQNARQQRLQQIVGNWGRFERGRTQPAGRGATVEFRYRNATKVQFEAWEIDQERLIQDVKKYLQRSPAQLNWEYINLQDLGTRVVAQNQAQYLRGRVADWTLDLKSRPEHVDENLTVTTPLQKPGAYLVTGRVAGGNVARVIVWVSDTALLNKMLDQQSYWFVGDADSGAPVAKANVEFFGWKQTQVAPQQNAYKVDTINFAEFSDADGQVLLKSSRLPTEYQWLVIARTAEGRLAFKGFEHIWYSPYYDEQYNATKVFAITDRPVYRPEQKVQFKFWVGRGQYDQPDRSDFAGQPFTVEIYDPEGQKVLDRSMKADDFGGLAAEYALPKDAKLGIYRLWIKDLGGGTFRVEEYKKPEFEVSIEAPSDPVKLGDKVTATLRAKYYFGTPVTQAKVKYKVLRSPLEARWFPPSRWDWLYGSGYWWFSPDYPWFPGWRDWGCARPRGWWWPGVHQPPEVVAERELPIGPDGTVAIEIDTLVAKELHGDQDHRYSITAEVVDESRRTIVGTGQVLVARKPFQVTAWVDRGYYRTGETVEAHFHAQTVDGKPVAGKGRLTLYRVSYDRQKPVEKAIENWDLDTNSEGEAQQQLKAAEPGQYRLSYRLTDAQQHTLEGGYLFSVIGGMTTDETFRFNDLELIIERREYAPGDKVKLLINTRQAKSTVLLFIRPSNSIYLPPRILRLDGKSTVAEIEVLRKDMPNLFVEALTLSDARLHTEMREIVVPPEQRVINVEVQPDAPKYLPGAPAKLRVRLTDAKGAPFVGSTVLAMYDKSVEYISGGSNVPDIKELFWKWRRQHRPVTRSSLEHYIVNLLRSGETPMSNLGAFGGQILEQQLGNARAMNRLQKSGAMAGGALPMSAPAGAAIAADKSTVLDAAAATRSEAGLGGGEPEVPPTAPTVRRNFADTALWVGSLSTDANGQAEVGLTMPENLTAWKIRTWALGNGTRVGEAQAEVVTFKNLLIRLQAPRFFVQTDEVVLSANIHSALPDNKAVRVSLELDGPTLSPTDELVRSVEVKAGGEQRVDWRVKVEAEGEAIVRMKAICEGESDAMEMRFPVYVHGFRKQDSYSGVIRPDAQAGQVEFTIPEQRRVSDSRFEARFSPTLAGALVDALPYLVEYPYGCTEQTLNRFLPTVITQRILQKMELDLGAIKQHRTNLNAQELGDAAQRAKGWKRFDRNPVFDPDEVKTMVAEGVRALTSMQLSDGGWGWFSGYGEHSWPHTTAVVVHGLQVAKQNDVALVPGMLERGIAWLKTHQDEEVQKLKNAPGKKDPWKLQADDLDAFVYMVLVDEGVLNNDMLEFLYRDRVQLSAYAKALYGLSLHKQQQAEKLDMISKNLAQFVVEDDENQTAYLRLPGEVAWWYWYGSETEANATYLKLLTRTDPRGRTASRLVKYLLNNRKHATYWNSTRDTALAIEALAEYLTASGEDRPELTVEVWFDGKKQKEVDINSKNLFTFDNAFVLEGDALSSGKHTLELKRRGSGPVYFNAYSTNFSLEDFITHAGLEVKVARQFYRLKRIEAKAAVAGGRGQALSQSVEKHEREKLESGALVASGDLIEVELVIDSKNDYEYLIFEDLKAAGCEPVEVRSGYNGNDMGAYVEFRDEKVCFFVRWLARGQHSVSYRLRAEIPGKFSALPARGAAMYAPELQGNSDEMKLSIRD